MAKSKPETTKPKVTETTYSYDVDYGDGITVVVPKDVVNGKAEAVRYADPHHKELLKNKKEK